MKTTTTCTNIRRIVATTIFGTLASTLAVVCTAADSTGAHQMMVHYGDLNVSTPQGAAALYSRIRAAADEVCRPLDRQDLLSKALLDKCVHNAITDAVNKVDQPALFSVFNAKQGKSRPIMLAASRTC